MPSYLTKLPSDRQCELLEKMPANQPFEEFAADDIRGGDVLGVTQDEDRYDVAWAASLQSRHQAPMRRDRPVKIRFCGEASLEDSVSAAPPPLCRSSGTRAGITHFTFRGSKKFPISGIWSGKNNFCKEVPNLVGEGMEK
ncbi:hypothetical protein [Devosia sp. A369]